MKPYLTRLLELWPERLDFWSYWSQKMERFSCSTGFLKCPWRACSPSPSPPWPLARDRRAWCPAVLRYLLCFRECTTTVLYYMTRVHRGCSVSVGSQHFALLTRNRLIACALSQTTHVGRFSEVDHSLEVGNGWSWVSW